MKVVFNAVSAKRGGAVTYLTHVLRLLPPPETGYEFFVFLPPETASAQKDLPSNIRLLTTGVGNQSMWKRLWWDQVTLRSFLKREKAEILFSTASFGMFFCPVKQVLLVRIPVFFSEIYERLFLTRRSLAVRINFALRRWLICRSVRHAEVVMTPTQAMLDDLRRYVDVPPEKALVNPYGVEVENPPQKDNGRQDELPPHDCPRQVRLLYVSLYNDYKNLTTLLRALWVLNVQNCRRFVLETTMDPAWEAVERNTLTREDDLELVRECKANEWLTVIGPLEWKQTQQLYPRADLFVFPSLCESFGHPMVEAMAHGLPIVAADTPVNREICAEAALYFTPLDAKDLARQVASVASDIHLRERLATEGRQRASAGFGWAAHVGRILDTWQSLVHVTGKQPRLSSRAAGPGGAS